MLYVRASLILILVGFAGVATAVELDLSLTATSGYDDNIFRTDKDTKDDASFRVGPTIRVRDETSKLSYNASYNPVYEQFVTWTEADELSHFANGALDYQLSDRTLLSLSENFRLSQSLNQGPLVANEDASGNDIDFVPETEVLRKDVYRNTASASVFHNFGARTQGEFTVTHDFFDSELANTSKNNSVSGFMNVMHSLTARDQVGLGGGATWQRFDGVRGQPRVDTFIFRLTGSWIHNFGQDTELTLQAGPAVIYTDQESARTGSEDLYPFKLVTNTKTIGQAYAAIGLNVPADVKDLNDNPLAASDVIGADSVLVPEATNAKCLNGMVSGQTVFDRSNCSFNVVVDAANPAFTGVANTIAGAGSVPLNFVSSNRGGSDTRITAFGEASISHHWLPELSSRASYTRSNSAATSLGSTSIADQATVETIWTPTRRWDLSVRGDWLKRKSPTDISNTFLVIDGTDAGGFGFDVVTSTALVTTTTNNVVDTEYWRVSGRAAYRTSRRSTVSLRASYQHQDTASGSSRGNSSFENVLVILGFRYDLDSFHF
jgi:hypothetical protein